MFKEGKEGRNKMRPYGLNLDVCPKNLDCQHGGYMDPNNCNRSFFFVAFARFSRYTVRSRIEALSTKVTQWDGT